MIGAGLGLRAVRITLMATWSCSRSLPRSASRSRRGSTGAFAANLSSSLGKPELIRLGEFDDIDMITITHTPHGADEVWRAWRYAITAR